MAEAGTGLIVAFAWRCACLQPAACHAIALDGTRRGILVEWGPAGVGDDPRCAQKGYAGSANQ